MGLKHYEIVKMVHNIDIFFNINRKNKSSLHYLWQKLAMMLYDLSHKQRNI